MASFLNDNFYWLYALLQNPIIITAFVLVTQSNYKLALKTPWAWLSPAFYFLLQIGMTLMSFSFSSELGFFENILAFLNSRAAVFPIYIYLPLALWAAIATAKGAKQRKNSAPVKKMDRIPDYK